MKPTLALAALIAVGAAAYAPLPSMAQTHFEVVIGNAPPAPLVERYPGPRHGYVWAPGYWEWRGHRHYWVPGSYVAARPGYVYAPPSWHHRHGGWYMEPGRWNRHDRDRDGIPDRYERNGYHHGYQSYGQPMYAEGYRHRDRDRDGIPDRYERRHRDTDRDGVPNRYDRDLDNDGVRNEHDRDRDGDGIRNRYDQRPSNPYRY